MDSLKLLLILSLFVASVVCISVPMDKFHVLILNRCFNETYDRKPLTLGQNYPVGMSIENLISLIEKIESKRPQLNAQQIILLILKRFHIDGLQLKGGSNMVSPVEMKHKKITEELLQSSAGSAVGSDDFPEDALTEDEKCALFFTLSHTVNETATQDEDVQHTYQKQVHLSRAPEKPDNKSLSTAMAKKMNTSQPIQSDFLPKPQTNNKSVPQIKPAPDRIAETAKTLESKQTDFDNEDNEDFDKRIKRQLSNMGPNTLTLTRRPRETGVASFRNDKYTAIATNRVLLGAAVGLLSPSARSTRDLIKSMSNIDTSNIPDGQVDPLLAVTMSDLLGIDAGSGLMIPVSDVMFGAQGEWNSTACQTNYKLTSNGTLATLAELRGGLDGWNIGRKLPTLFQQNPKIALSQILRQYYSPRGLASDSGVCNRGYGLVGELQNKLQREAENYIRVWNGLFYEGSYFDTQLTGFVAQTWPSFYQFLSKAGQDKTSDERDFCNPSIGTDMKSIPCETTADVLFLLDNMPAQGTGNQEEIEIVKEVSKSLNLGRNAGSVTILVNAQGSANPSIVDDNNNQLNPPLYALVYNTTSSQCASCRAAWFDNSQMSLTDRPMLMELVNKTLMEFKLQKADLAGVPSKNLIWFDYGNLKPIPTDRENKKKYDDFKWRLRYQHRDTTFFMAGINKDSIKDLLRRDEDWIPVGTGIDAISSQTKDLVNKICQTPQIFQHNECRVKDSKGKLYQGYLTPGYKQYWAMYPEYFIKSYTIDMKFKAEKTRIKVCFERYMNPENYEKNCFEAKDDGSELNFKVKNPCHGKTFESCAPFYFTVGLSSQSGQQISGNTDCNDPGCRSVDQVKWSFSHTGISCNKSSGLLPNWTFQLICFVLFLTLFCINGKRN